MNSQLIEEIIESYNSSSTDPNRRWFFSEDILSEVQLEKFANFKRQTVFYICQRINEQEEKHFLIFYTPFLPPYSETNPRDNFSIHEIEQCPGNVESEKKKLKFAMNGHMSKLDTAPGRKSVTTVLYDKEEFFYERMVPHMVGTRNMSFLSLIFLEIKKIADEMKRISTLKEPTKENNEDKGIKSFIKKIESRDQAKPTKDMREFLREKIRSERVAKLLKRFKSLCGFQQGTTAVTSVFQSLFTEIADKNNVALLSSVLGFINSLAAILFTHQEDIQAAKSVLYKEFNFPYLLDCLIKKYGLSEETESLPEDKARSFLKLFDDLFQKEENQNIRFVRMLWNIAVHSSKHFIFLTPIQGEKTLFEIIFEKRNPACLSFINDFVEDLRQADRKSILNNWYTKNFSPTRYVDLYKRALNPDPVPADQSVIVNRPLTNRDSKVEEFIISEIKELINQSSVRKLRQAFYCLFSNNTKNMDTKNKVKIWLLLFLRNGARQQNKQISEAIKILEKMPEASLFCYLLKNAQELLSKKESLIQKDLGTDQLRIPSISKIMEQLAVKGNEPFRFKTLADMLTHKGFVSSLNEKDTASLLLAINNCRSPVEKLILYGLLFQFSIKPFMLPDNDHALMDQLKALYDSSETSVEADILLEIFLSQGFLDENFSLMEKNEPIKNLFLAVKKHHDKKISAARMKIHQDFFRWPENPAIFMAFNKRLLRLYPGNVMVFLEKIMAQENYAILLDIYKKDISDALPSNYEALGLDELFGAAERYGLGYNVKFLFSLPKVQQIVLNYLNTPLLTTIDIFVFYLERMTLNRQDDFILEQAWMRQLIAKKLWNASLVERQSKDYMTLNRMFFKTYLDHLFPLCFFQSPEYDLPTLMEEIEKSSSKKDTLNFAKELMLASLDDLILKKQVSDFITSQIIIDLKDNKFGKLALKAAIALIDARSNISLEQILFMPKWDALEKRELLFAIFRCGYLEPLMNILKNKTPAEKRELFSIQLIMDACHQTNMESKEKQKIILELLIFYDKNKLLKVGELKELFESFLDLFVEKMIVEDENLRPCRFFSLASREYLNKISRGEITDFSINAIILLSFISYEEKLAIFSENKDFLFWVYKNYQPAISLLLGGSAPHLLHDVLTEMPSFHSWWMKEWENRNRNTNASQNLFEPPAKLPSLAGADEIPILFAAFLNRELAALREDRIVPSVGENGRFQEMAILLNQMEIPKQEFDYFLGLAIEYAKNLSLKNNLPCFQLLKELVFTLMKINSTSPCNLRFKTLFHQQLVEQCIKPYFVNLQRRPALWPSIAQLYCIDNVRQQLGLADAVSLRIKEEIERAKRVGNYSEAEGENVRLRENHSESAMAEPEKEQVDAIEELKIYYGSRIPKTERELDDAIKKIEDAIAVCYSKNPAKYNGRPLPLTYEEFKNSFSNLGSEEQKQALKAYYEHEIHSGYRFLLPNNPWINPLDKRVYFTRGPNGHACTYYRSHRQEIILYWLAVTDEKRMPQSGNIENRILNFISFGLAENHRAHNRDGARDPSTGRVRVFDDGEADRPSCNNGISNRLFNGLTDHPVKKTILSTAVVEACYRTAIYNGYKAKFLHSHLTLNEKAKLREACEDCFLATYEDDTPQMLAIKSLIARYDLGSDPSDWEKIENDVIARCQLKPGTVHPLIRKVGNGFSSLVNETYPFYMIKFFLFIESLLPVAKALPKEIVDLQRFAKTASDQDLDSLVEKIQAVPEPPMTTPVAVAAKHSLFNSAAASVPIQPKQRIYTPEKFKEAEDVERDRKKTPLSRAIDGLKKRDTVVISIYASLFQKPAIAKIIQSTLDSFDKKTDLPRQSSGF